MFSKLQSLIAIITSPIRKYFLFGLFVALPFAITIQFLIFVVTYLDKLLAVKNGHFLFFIPAQFHPNELTGYNIPGLGLIIMFLLITAVGIFSRNYVGKRTIKIFDGMMGKIPFARTIYHIVRDFLQTYSKRDKNQFSRVVLVEYPRLGIYTLGFVTGKNYFGLHKTVGKDLVNVFVPTSPNPTSGFFLLVPESELTYSELSVENAFRLIVSAGSVSEFSELEENNNE
ncbi:MAG: DUF502 domain-containing protein [Bdellovibrionales bacterium]|nr:DUF502 domain-containing protein [Bdellovibrionales bacterium]